MFPQAQPVSKVSEPTIPAGIGSTGGAGKTASVRLTSIDAYRGLVMLLMMGEVLEFCRVSAALPMSSFWSFLCHHQSHVEWVGCSLHDLIQPSFSFLVGVALPFSVARRVMEGQPQVYRTLHAFWRALVLVLLGVFLRSLGQPQTYWTFEDTLTQIGLGYGFLYLLALRSARAQWMTFAIILIGYWLAFALYPLPGSDFNWHSAGVSPDWANLLTGFSAHWNKNTNLAWAFDGWFLNLFPREHPFDYNEGGYCTLSFIPTLGTMILGLLAGSVIRSERAPWAKVKWLAIAGVVGLVAGMALGWLGICPVVKRIWTPSWTLFSGGWCMILMAGFYALTDLQGWKRWAFPLVVVGMNSIAAYCMAHLFEDFIVSALATHLGANTFMLLGKAYEPLMKGGLVLLVMWAILFWMYRRKIFLRI
jgi:heparan-alpha-glucosaminide N-acetyltransferase